MKPFIATALTALALSMGGGAFAQTPPAAKGAPAVLLTENYAVEAEVVLVDQATRTVTLKAEDGTVSAGVVGPEVKNLAQVKVGDKVRAQYSQALALNLKKGGGMRSKTESSDSSAAAPGQKPAAAVMREVHFVADITQLDAKTGAVTLKGPEGRTLDVKLKDPSVLEGYAAGDQVEGTFLQVLAIGAVGPDGTK
jgi:hypothetical protein